MKTFIYTVDRIVTTVEQTKVTVMAEDQDQALDEVLRRSEDGELVDWFRLDEGGSDEQSREDPVLIEERDGPTMVTCSLCGIQTPEATAHRHQDGWIGDACCWDERLRASE